MTEEDVRAAESLDLTEWEAATVDAWRVHMDCGGPRPPRDSLAFAADPSEHPDFDMYSKILPLGRVAILDATALAKGKHHA